jgi:excisionase family DNA binding protein
MSRNLTEFVSPKQVAAALQVHPSTVSKWISQLKIPAIKIGKAVRIRRRDYEAWLKDHASRTAL